jgi:hypothetical protein
VVNRWGGLVVRSPAWLAIDPAGWATQRSNVVHWRGWELVLIAQPKALAFDVDFVPDPARPSTPFTGVVPCVAPGDRPQPWVGAFPGPPVDLASFAEPGVGGPCMWTPPGPGWVTITARVTFTVTFWVSGATEAQPDYVWASAPEQFRVGELRVVNTNG